MSFEILYALLYVGTGPPLVLYEFAHGRCSAVLQVGQVDLHWLNQQLIDYEQQDIFEIRQYQSRKKAIELLSDAALFYFGLSADEGQGITPIRIYTLLTSGRPLLAYAPSGSEIDKIVAKHKNSFRFDDNAIDKASDFVCRQAERFLKGDLSFNILPDGVAQFSSERMVEKFARLFDEVLGK
ncbi:MAG: glycosyltransferase [candidate division Zixibacteria bacterium]|nr:glycosyltransferase [candidate division Zixibacteria bacterium]